MLRRFVKKKTGKEHKRPKPRQNKDLRYYWDRHWETVVAVISALIVGLLIVPMFFR